MAQGGCLCGGVRFEYTGRATPIQICHAKRCQRASGSAFQPEMAVEAEGFRWLSGEGLVQNYEAPLLREPPPLRRAFCRTCGSPVPVVWEGRPWVSVLAGSLDGDAGTRPVQHIFLSESPAWFSAPEDGLPRFPERPPPERRLRWRTPGSGEQH